MKIENVNQINLYLDNSELITFNSSDVIHLALLDETTYICANGIPPIKLEIIVSHNANRNEIRMWEFMDQVLPSENESGEIQYRNNFQRLLLKSDILTVVLKWEDGEISTLKVPYLDQEYNSSELRDCWLDQDENLHISLFIVDDVIFDESLS